MYSKYGPILSVEQETIVGNDNLGRNRDRLEQRSESELKYSERYDE